MLENITRWLIYSVSTFIVVFEPIYMIWQCIFIVVILDLFAAIIKAHIKANIKTNINKKTKRNIFKTIKSRGIGRTLLKLGFYLTFIGAIYYTELAIFSTSLYITNAAAFLVLIRELKSIAEKGDIILGNNILTDIIDYIKNKFINKIDKNISGEDGE